MKADVASPPLPAFTARPSMAALCVISATAGLLFNIAPQTTNILRMVFGLSPKQIAYHSAWISLGFGLGIVAAMFRFAIQRLALVVGLLLMALLAPLYAALDPMAAAPLFALPGFGCAMVVGGLFRIVSLTGDGARAVGLLFAAQMLAALIANAFLESPLSLTVHVSGLVMAHTAMIGLSLFCVKAVVYPGVTVATPSIPWRDKLSAALVMSAIATFLTGIVGIWTFLVTFENAMSESSFVSWTILSLVFAMLGSLAATVPQIIRILPLSVALVGAAAVAGCFMMAVPELALFGLALLSFGWNFGLAVGTARLGHFGGSASLVPLALAMIGVGGALGAGLVGWRLEVGPPDEALHVAAMPIGFGFAWLALLTMRAGFGPDIKGDHRGS
ncbi:hypothetical protein [uncultured Algimonas sp.]|uniref:hypothetical protein n=1 Tax=uncultured Algimonas sp. TaxID=1547920 RepID=UPI0026029801|nr:hypothetical protein [uncultured Algimonas sp.]